MSPQLSAVLRNLRRASIIPSEIELLLLPDKTRIIVSLSDTSERTFGEFDQYLDLEEFQRFIRSSRFSGEECIVFYDYAWSYLTASEQKQILQIVSPETIVVTGPDIEQRLQCHLLNLQPINLLLCISVRKYLDELEISYTGFRPPNYTEDFSYQQNCTLLDIRGMSIRRYGAYQLDTAVLTTNTDNINCFIYSRG